MMKFISGVREKDRNAFLLMRRGLIQLLLQIPTAAAAPAANLLSCTIFLYVPLLAKVQSVPVALHSFVLLQDFPLTNGTQDLLHPA